MLFHLGVIKALRETKYDEGMALAAVVEIYAVSGGSILAAHFLKNRVRYLGDDAAFQQACAEILALAQRDIRNRIVRRWGLTWWLGKSRTYWLQHEYRSLLGDTRIGSCYDGDAPPPTVHFLTTNFKTGELCSFSGTNFEKLRRDGSVTTDSTPAEGVPLVYAVAASSAFPPMFPPLRLSPDQLGLPDNREFRDRIELSDGGIYDNFGIEKFCSLRHDGMPPVRLIVSHASGSFDTAPGRSYDSVLSRNIRASDIMMRRVGEASLAAGALAGGADFTLIRIGETVSDGSIGASTQQLLRLVRTDLDRFEPDLAGLLVDHGHRTALAALGHPSAPAPAYDDRREARLALVARRGAQRRILPLFTDLRDGLWLLLWWLIVAGIATLAWLAVTSYLDSRRKEQELNLSRLAALNLHEQQLEDIRAATAAGDIDRIRAVLASAIVTAQDVGNRPDSAVRVAAGETPGSSEPPQDSPAEVSRTIDNPAPLPAFEQTLNAQRVFIQFAGDLSRAEITELNQDLAKAGWNMQGSSGERIPTAAGRHEIRYSGDNATAAADLARAINDSNLVSGVEPKLVPIIGRNTLEAWISR